jgi:hypothetical protein
MTTSTLTKILELLQDNDDPLSLGYIAHQLDISPEKTESMLQFWIKKGKISITDEEADCGACSENSSCPFIYKLPTSYKLSEDDSGLKHL